MANSRCPIEKDNIRKGLEKCPLDDICNSKYKEVCHSNRKIIKEMEIVI